METQKNKGLKFVEEQIPKSRETTNLPRRRLLTKKPKAQHSKKTLGKSKVKKRLKLWKPIILKDVKL